jgi:hypothetical protein
MSSRTRRILVVVAALAVVAGVVVAVTSFHSSGKGSAPASSSASAGELAAAAAYLGLSAPELRAQLRSGKSLAQIAAHTAGRSESGLVNALVAARSAAVSAEESKGKISHQVASKRVAALRRRVAGTIHRTGLVLGIPEPAAAARYLGITTPKLRRELRTGLTPAEVADRTPGRSASGLVAAIVAARRQRLDAAVAAGRMSHARESLALARLQRRISALVAGTSPGA